MLNRPVPDIRLVQDARFPRYSVTIDWKLLDNGTLDDTQALATPIVGGARNLTRWRTHRRTLPDPDSTNREGWWGDLDADTIWNAWPIGSKLWLLRRSAIESVDSRQGSTVARVLAYIHLALQPFVDRRIASRFNAYAARVTAQRIDSQIIIYRGPTPVIEMLYSILWDEQQQATQTGRG